MDKTPMQPDSKEPNLTGIGGWLVLPAFGLIVAPIVLAVDLWGGLQMLDHANRAGIGGVVAASIVGDLAMIVLLLIAASQFFRRKRNAPTLMITVYITQLAIMAILLFVGVQSKADGFVSEVSKSFSKTIVAAAIWIPYFCKSKRVKATFTK